MTIGTRALSAQFRAHRHSAFLAAIVAAFAVRPLIGDGGAAPIVFSVALLAMLLMALLTIRVEDLIGDRDALLAQRRKLSIVAYVLAIPAVAERLLFVFLPSSRLLLAGSISWTLFIGFVTWCQLRSVLRQREVTAETISNAVSIYLLLGLTWGLLYAVIFQFQPHAFNFGASSPPSHGDVFPVFAYLSLATISTIGFGDITPVTLQARYAAVAEGITGQFYMALLVARLVAMQMSRGATATRTRQ
jgi:amino acid transporter